MKKIPKKIYGNGINLSGLYSKKPMLLTYNCILKDEWWAKDGNFSVSGLGLIVEGGRITFASKKRKDVLCWIAGVLSTMTLLKRWSQ